MPGPLTGPMENLAEVDFALYCLSSNFAFYSPVIPAAGKRREPPERHWSGPYCIGTADLDMAGFHSEFSGLVS